MKTGIKQSVRLMLLMFLSSAMLLVSCSQGTDLTTYVPEDAIVVGNVDVKTIWQKGDVDNIDNLSFVKLLRQEFRSENPQMAALVDEIIKDPSSSGLNLKSDVLFYCDMNKATVLAQMKKESQFESFVKKCFDLGGDRPDFKSENGYKTVELDEGMVVAYNNDVAMLVVELDGSLSNCTIEDMMHLKKDRSIASNKKFREYWKNHKELSAWMDMRTMLDLAERYGGKEAFEEVGLSREYMDELKKGSLSMNLSFDKGVIRFSTETQGIDAKVWNVYRQKFNSSLVKYMPEKTFAAISYAVNTKELMKMLSSMRDMDIDLNEELVDGVTVKQLIESLDGSMVFSLFDFEGMMPMMAAAVDINNSGLIEKLLKEAGLVQRDGYYTLSEEILDGMNIYMATNGKVLYATNSAIAVRQFLAGGRHTYSSSYGNSMSAVANKVKEGNYIYIDLNLNHYPSSLTGMIPGNVVQLLSQYFDYTEFLATGDNSAEWRLYLANSKENSLLYTLKFIDDHLVEFANLAESFGGSSCPEVTEEFYVDEDDDIEWDWDD